MSRAELPGTSLRRLERFEILRSLGEGGHGVVYEARDRQRRQLVALKLLRDASAEGIYRFKQEFRNLSNIHHHNLARLDELFSDGPDWFFTMELVDGVSFLQHVRPAFAPADAAAPDAASALSFDEIRLRAALRQLVEGVLALHGAGKLHRDLKPANVLVTRAGRVVILDFGVSAELSDLEQSMSLRIAGTPSYMAPEQAEGAPPSEASDWYAVGVMLFEALTGQNPFEGSLLESLLRKRTGIKPPSFIAAGIPADLDALCWDLLAPQPGERPSGSEIRRRLGVVALQTGSEAAPDLPPRAPRVLIGRDTELAVLEAAFQGRGHGKPVIVRVHGDSGVGKSALIAHVVERLTSAQRALVLTGRCHERESMPYKALDGLIDVLSQRLRHLPADVVASLVPADATALSRLFPVLGRVEAIANAPRDPYADAQDALVVRRRAWNALAELFRRLSQRGPMVLLVDDLQWADADSVELLAPLLHGDSAIPLLLVASYRRREAAGTAFLALLDQLQQAGVQTIDLPIEPLPSDVSRALVARLTSGLGPEQLQDIVQESGGNPFLLEQLSRHAAQGWQGGGHSLRDLIDVELSRLPAAARALLQLVTVAGGPVERDWLRRAVETRDAAEAWQGLLAEQLLRDTHIAERPAVDTYHDRIREAVRDGLSDAEKVALHGRWVSVIESSNQPDAELLATQLQGANLPQRAAVWACRAADEALAALAFERATRLYQWALELDSEAADVRLQCWVGLGESLSGESKGAAAAAALLQAAQLAPERALELRRRAAEHLLRSGQIDQGVEVLREVLSSLGLGMPATQTGAMLSFLWHRLLLSVRGLGYRLRRSDEIDALTLARLDACWAASVGLSIADTIRGAEFHARYILLALRAGEPYRIARALATEVGAGGMPGRRARPYVERVTQLAQALALDIDQPHAQGLVLFWAAVGFWLVGRWRECREGTERSEQIFRDRCRGASWELASSQMFRLSSCIWTGEFSEHQRLQPEFLRDARERDDVYAVTTLTLLTYSHVPRLAADDPAGAAQLTENAQAGWSQRGFHLQHLWALYARVEVNLYRGDVSVAREELERTWGLAQRSQLLRMQTIRSLLQHLRGRVSLAASAEPGALRMAKRMTRRIRAERLDWSTGMAELLQAGLELARGDVAGAARALERAESLLRAADMQMHAAAARRRRGELSNGEAGLELVTSADAWMRAQGVVHPERFAAFYVPLPGRAAGSG